MVVRYGTINENLKEKDDDNSDNKDNASENPTI